MSFSFGFENDDIEDTVHEVESEMTEPAVLIKPSVKLAKPELHNLRTLVSRPDRQSRS